MQPSPMMDGLTGHPPPTPMCPPNCASWCEVRHERRWLFRHRSRCLSLHGRWRRLNTAIAHLIMARGTGRDNRTTQWSVHAIEQRTGISRPNASRAVKDLLARGISKEKREGKHPIYEAVPGSQIPGGPFTADEQEAIAAIRDGKEVPYETYESSASIKALVGREAS